MTRTGTTKTYVFAWQSLPTHVRIIRRGAHVVWITPRCLWARGCEVIDVWLASLSAGAAVFVAVWAAGEWWLSRGPGQCPARWFSFHGESDAPCQLKAGHLGWHTFPRDLDDGSDWSSIPPGFASSVMSSMELRDA